MSSYYPLYWPQGRNFGDALNPLLYEAITGRRPAYSNTDHKILAIGSVLYMACSHDIVWGAGLLAPEITPFYNPSIQFRAVRGPLTCEVLAKKGFELPTDLPLGCPAWLLPHYVQPAGKIEHEVGFIPHYVDYGQVRTLPSSVKLLWTATPPLELVGQITSCRVIVSSCLHGIIVAEAYGIPAVWVELGDYLVGKGFKFRDYYQSTGRTVEPLDWREGYDWDRARELAAERHYAVPEERKERLMAACPFNEEVL